MHSEFKNSKAKLEAPVNVYCSRICILSCGRWRPKLLKFNNFFNHFFMQLFTFMRKPSPNNKVAINNF